MLVHGRPFTEILVSGLPDDLSRAHQPVFSSGAVATAPVASPRFHHAESAAPDLSAACEHVSAPRLVRFCISRRPRRLTYVRFWRACAGARLLAYAI